MALVVIQGKFITIPKDHVWLFLKYLNIQASIMFKYLQGHWVKDIVGTLVCVSDVLLSNTPTD